MSTVRGNCSLIVAEFILLLVGFQLVKMTRRHLIESERARIVNMRFEFHRTYSYIARRIKCSSETARRVCLQHSHHVDHIKRRQHGRKSALSPKLLKHMFAVIKSNQNMTSAELSRHLFHHDHVVITPRTIRRYRRSRLHAVHEILVPPLKLQHYLDRIEYCMVNATNNFHRYVFSDEKPFCLAHTSNVVWIEDGEPIPTREISSSHTSVMVWGAIWYNGRTELGIVEGSIDRYKYIDVLKQYLLPSMPSSTRFTFVHDNAGPHRPIEVRKFLHDYAVKLIYKWPAQSPDFNPIEHVWSWMVHYVNKMKPHNRATLVDAIRSAWSAIPQSVIRGYIDGLPARLQAVYNNGGARLD